AGGGAVGPASGPPASGAPGGGAPPPPAASPPPPLAREGMPRVIFESLAAAKPLIAARVGVVPEVLTDGEHAALVPAGDAQALAAALERLVGDAAAASRLGEGGRRLVGTRYSGARGAAALGARYATPVGTGAAGRSGFSPPPCRTTRQAARTCSRVSCPRATRSR